MKKKFLGILSLGFFLTACGSSSLDYNKGIYRSEDFNSWGYITEEGRGDTKSAINDDLYKILVNPKDRSQVFASGANNLYKSNDTGNNWSTKGGIGLSQIYDIAFDQGDEQALYAVGTDSEGVSKLRRSMNGGNEWETVYEHPVKESAIRSMSVNPVNKNEIVVGTTTGEVLKSSDYGRNWKIIFFTGKKKFPIKFISHNKRFPDIVTFFSNDLGFYISRDGGENFEAVLDPLKEINAEDDIYAFSTDAKTPNRYYLGGEEGLFVTNDYGSTWSRIDTLITPGSAPVYGVQVNPNDSRNIFVGTKGAILISENGGETWNSTVIEEMSDGGFTDFGFCEWEVEGDLVDRFVAGSNDSFSKGIL